MAERTLLLRVIADDRDLQRSMLKDQAAVEKFGKGTTVSLSRVDQAFTKTQKLMAGGFVGGAAFAAGVAAIKSVVAAASDSQQILGQTRVALEATGKSWEDYGKQIETTVKAQSRLGFDDEALLKTFSLFERNTGDVTRALELNNVAMDVARGRFIDLDQAAQLVNKAALGQAGALRRLGIDAKNGASGLELITLLQDKYAGSARNAADTAQGSFDRVNVSVENVKESLGTLLLPAVQALADDLDAAARSAELLVSGLGEIGKIKIPTIHIPFAFDVPGTGGTLGDLAGKAASIAKFTPLNPLFGATIAKGIADQFDHQTKAALPDVKFRFGKSLDDLIAAATSGTKVNPADFAKLPGVSEKGVIARQIGDVLGAVAADAKKQVKDAIKATNASIAKEASAKAAAQRADALRNFVDALGLNVDKAGLTKRIDDDLKALFALKAGLEKQIKAGVDVAAAQTQLVSVMGQIASKQDEVRKASAEALQARQFRSLGLSSTGDDIVPGIENLSKRLNAALSKISSGELDVSSKLASRLKAARTLIRKEGKNLTEETRKAINDFLKAASGEDSKTKTGPKTLTTTINVDKILAGLGLSRDLEKEIRARLSGFNSAGVGLAGKPARTFSTGAAGAPIVVENVNTVMLDGDVVGRSVTRSQQKAGRRNPRQKRGPNTRSGV